MRVPLVLIAAMVALLSAPRLALAEDGGDGGMVDEGGPDATQSDASSGEDSGSTDGASNGGCPFDAAYLPDGSCPAVVACDGGLCDTLQGRPTCAVSPGVGGVAGDPEWLSLVPAAMMAFLARRRTRGASRPTRGGRA